MTSKSGPVKTEPTGPVAPPLIASDTNMGWNVLFEFCVLLTFDLRMNAA